MLQQIPASITTTQIQRNPKLLSELNENGEVRIIIKDSEQIGVYSPIEKFNELLNKLNELEEEVALHEIAKSHSEIQKALKSKKGLGSLLTLDEAFKDVPGKD